MTATPLTYEWGLHEQAERLVDDLVAAAVSAGPRLRRLCERLAGETSTRLNDWLDHVGGPVEPTTLAAAGYVDGWRTRPGIWRHPGAQLPAIVPGERLVALRVDDAAAFAQAHGSTAGVRGAPLSGFRRAVISGDEPVMVAGVERRSWACGVEPDEPGQAGTVAAVRAWRMWAERPRHLDDVAAQAALAREMVALAGPGLAASYFLELERRYWQRRNTAAVLQHGRQDRLGLGWGNNDHHTFRSGRGAFRDLILLLGDFGFEPRERFYAGAEAGWGAQVLEHPDCGGVIFADVDLEPGELDIDFTAGRLPPASRLGTVGLWCALHGESILAAGMHHLEGQFDFDALRADLNVRHMAPFSDFPHLRQAFTEAERWPVAPERLARLVAAGTLDTDAAARFARDGAAGSHLENLARRAGFKGFNQTNVSTTMRATDPRDYRPGGS